MSNRIKAMIAGVCVVAAVAAASVVTLGPSAGKCATDMGCNPPVCKSIDCKCGCTGK